MNLSKDDDFFVYLKLSHGGQPIDRTSEIPVLLGSTFANTVVPSSASVGESFYYNNGSWIDLYTYDFPSNLWNKTANFCVKALTAKIKMETLLCTGQHMKARQMWSSF